MELKGLSVTLTFLMISLTYIVFSVVTFNPFIYVVALLLWIVFNPVLWSFIFTLFEFVYSTASGFIGSLIGSIGGPEGSAVGGAIGTISGVIIGAIVFIASLFSRIIPLLLGIIWALLIAPILIATAASAPFIPSTALGDILVTYLFAYYFFTRNEMALYMIVMLFAIYSMGTVIQVIYLVVAIGLGLITAWLFEYYSSGVKDGLCLILDLYLVAALGFRMASSFGPMVGGVPLAQAVNNLLDSLVRAFPILSPSYVVIFLFVLGLAEGDISWPERTMWLLAFFDILTWISLAFHQFFSIVNLVLYGITPNPNISVVYEIQRVVGGVIGLGSVYKPVQVGTFDPSKAYFFIIALINLPLTVSNIISASAIYSAFGYPLFILYYSIGMLIFVPFVLDVLAGTTNYDVTSSLRSLPKAIIGKLKEAQKEKIKEIEEQRRKEEAERRKMERIKERELKRQMREQWKLYKKLEAPAIRRIKAAITAVKKKTPSIPALPTSTKKWDEIFRRLKAKKAAEASTEARRRRAKERKGFLEGIRSVREALPAASKLREKLKRRGEKKSSKK